VITIQAEEVAVVADQLARLGTEPVAFLSEFSSLIVR
jgi:hypothetical protein